VPTFVDRLVRYPLGLLGVRSRYVETDVARHHVYDTGGTGSPIVCLPGLSDSAASWAPIVLALRRRGHRVLVVEGAGHGLSDEATGAYSVDAHFSSVGRVLDEVLAGPAVLVGNSLGGATAIDYAVRRPVAGVFLASPGGGRMDDVALASIRRSFDIRSVADARAFLERVVARPSVRHRVLARVVLASSRARGVREILESLRPELVSEGIAGIEAPIRLVWGRAERLLPAASLEWLREQLPPHAVIIEPDGFGHCPHLDDPMRLAKMILEFVGEVRAGAGAPLAIPRQRTHVRAPS
jgi:pimeloyl-ACP methyl ester carboxylesterase